MENVQIFYFDSYISTFNKNQYIKPIHHSPNPEEHFFMSFPFHFNNNHQQQSAVCFSTAMGVGLHIWLPGKTADVSYPNRGQMLIS